MKEKKYYKKIAINIAKIADSKKAKDIFIYDIEKYNNLFYYTILMTIESYPQAEAIAEEIQKKLKKEKVYPLYKDGMQSRNWKVIDYGGILVHILEYETRNFYGLDKLYYQCKTLSWKKEKITRK